MSVKQSSSSESPSRAVRRIEFESGKNVASEIKSPIKTQDDLEKALPVVCGIVYQTLGSQNLEATYQRVLAIELEQLGCIINQEVEIAIYYTTGTGDKKKSYKVGTRRADVLVTLADDSQAILELKATAKASIAPDNIRQLKLYMHHMDIATGYVINFPHDRGFGSDTVDSLDYMTRDFTQFHISGDTGEVNDRDARCNFQPAAPGTSGTPPQIKKLTMTTISPSKRTSTLSPRATLPTPTKRATENTVTESKSTNKVSKTWGITQKGDPCKVCIRYQTFCKHHKIQASNLVTA